MDLAGTRVLVTGGGGFLGSRVVAALRRRGCRTIIAPRQSECDLRDQASVRSLCRDAKPGVVIHCAATVGGIGANRAHPGSFFFDNLMMGVPLMEEARRAGVEKFVALGTVCAYPKFTPVPFREDQLWDGYPEETNAPYGLAKKMLLVQAQAYRQEYGFNAIFLLPVNLYGPGDKFDPKASHVIPALIRKCVDAVRDGAPEIVVWGTGTASREFLYVDDCAEGIVLATERYDGAEPVNLGTGREVTIRDLVAMIAREVGFTGRIVWDQSQPDGQPRRCLDTTRAEQLFGFRAATSFEAGLRETVRWYLAQRDQQPATPGSAASA